MWYQFGPFEAYYEMERYDDVLIYVESNLSNGGEYVEETYYWQGRALAAQGQTNAARSAYREALRRNYLFEDAQIALNALG
jgi:tetratricopeptide (TPR) repeat protein